MNETRKAAQAALGDVAKILEQRDTHGDPALQHGLLGQLWTSFLLQPGPDGAASMRHMTPENVMFMMLLMKVARVHASGVQTEHVEDIAGYAGLILGVLAQAEAEE